MKNYTSPAFTLPELAVALTILGILAVLVVPRAASFLVQARRGEAKANLAHIKSLQAIYRLEHGSASSGWIVGYDQGVNRCNDNDDKELLNKLGFNPKGCEHLRYSYYVDGTKYYAYGPSDKDGKWIYPDCPGGTADECRATAGDKIETSDSAPITVCRNIIKYCPGSGAGGNTLPPVVTSPKTCANPPTGVDTNCPSGKVPQPNLSMISLSDSDDSAVWDLRCCKDPDPVCTTPKTEGSPPNCRCPECTDSSHIQNTDSCICTPPSKCSSLALSRTIGGVTRDRNRNRDGLTYTNVAECYCPSSTPEFENNACVGSCNSLRATGCGTEDYRAIAPKNNTPVVDSRDFKTTCCCSLATPDWATSAAGKTCCKDQNSDGTCDTTPQCRDVSRRECTGLHSRKIWKDNKTGSTESECCECDSSQQSACPDGSIWNANTPNCCKAQTCAERLIFETIETLDSLCARSDSNRPKWQGSTGSPATTAICCGTSTPPEPPTGTPPVDPNCANPPASVGRPLPQCPRWKTLVNTPSLSSTATAADYLNTCCQCSETEKEILPGLTYCCTNNDVPIKCDAGERWDLTGPQTGATCTCTTTPTPPDTCNSLHQDGETCEHSNRIYNSRRGPLAATTDNFDSVCCECKTEANVTCENNWESYDSSKTDCCHCDGVRKPFDLSGTQCCTNTPVPTTCPRRAGGAWLITGDKPKNSTCECRENCQSLDAKDGIDCASGTMRKDNSDGLTATASNFQNTCCEEDTKTCGAYTSARSATTETEKHDLCSGTDSYLGPDNKNIDRLTRQIFQKTDGTGCCEKGPDPKSCQEFWNEEPVASRPSCDDGGTHLPYLPYSSTGDIKSDTDFKEKCCKLTCQGYYEEYAGDKVTRTQFCATKGTGFRAENPSLWETMYLSGSDASEAFKNTCCKPVGCPPLVQCHGEATSQKQGCINASGSPRNNSAGCYDTCDCGGGGSWQGGAGGGDPTKKCWCIGRRRLCSERLPTTAATCKPWHLKFKGSNNEPNCCVTKKCKEVEDQDIRDDCPSDKQWGDGDNYVDKDRPQICCTPKPTTPQYTCQSPPNTLPTTLSCLSGDQIPDTKKTYPVGAGISLESYRDTCCEPPLDDSCAGNAPESNAPNPCPTPTVKKWTEDTSKLGTTSAECCIAKTCDQWRTDDISGVVKTSDQACGENLVFLNGANQIPAGKLNSPTTYCCSQMCKDVPSTTGSERKACEADTECTWNTTTDEMPNCTTCQNMKTWSWNGTTGSCGCSVNSACDDDDNCSLDSNCTPVCANVMDGGIIKETRRWTGSVCVCNSASLDIESSHQGDDSGIFLDSGDCAWKCDTSDGYNDLSSSNESPYCCPTGEIKNPNGGCCTPDPDSNKCHEPTPVQSLACCYLQGLAFAFGGLRKQLIDRCCNDENDEKITRCDELKALSNNLGISTGVCGNVSDHESVWNAYKEAEVANCTDGIILSNIANADQADLVDAVKNGSDACGNLGRGNPPCSPVGGAACPNP